MQINIHKTLVFFDYEIIISFMTKGILISMNIIFSVIIVCNNYYNNNIMLCAHILKMFCKINFFGLTNI